MQISSTSTSPATQTLAVNCSRCLDDRGTVPQVTLPVAPRPTTKPTHCPTCHRLKPYRPQDYADVLCNTYPSLTRKGALHAIATYNELQLRGKLPKDTLDALDIPATLWGLNRMLAASPITPLTVSCTVCAGQYTILRSTSPSVQHTVPLYCVWCGSSQTTHVSQDDTEDTAWLSLAHHYTLSVQALQFFYAQWAAQAQVPTLALYLDLPTVAPLVAAARASAS